MAGVPERKYTALRKRLDQLGYRQALGIESVPLVERLFNDLIHTTESLKKAKLQAGKTVKEKGSWEEQIEPYRSENAKLMKESNDLHVQLIRLKDELDSTSKDLKSTIRKLEHENADLRFLNSQYVHKVRALERDCKSRNDRIAHLQEKNFHAVVQTPGGRKKNIPFRRQRMDIDCSVPGANYSPAGIPPGVDDPYVADLMNVADERVEKMQRDVEGMMERHEADQRAIKSLRKQVDNRDQEISRLSRLLEGGRPLEVVSTEAQNRSNERLISHLNIQIEYLQQANRELERELKDSRQAREAAVEENIVLKGRNDELAGELRDVDRLAKRLQADRDSVMATADKDMIEAKTELTQSTREIKELDIEVEQLRQERKNLLDDIDALRSEGAAKQQNIKRLQNLVDKIQEDKRKLSERVNKLTANERELVLELERMRKKVGGKARKDAPPTKLDSYTKALEEERDYYKGEVEVLNRILRNKDSSSSGAKDRSPKRSQSPGKGSRSASPSRSTSKDTKTDAHYEAIIRVLEDERNFYKREYETLKALRAAQKASSPLRKDNISAMRDLRISDEAEMLKLRRERDDLQSLLDKFERHMAEIQTNVKVLTSERDKVNLLYQQANDELQRLRQEAVKSPKSSRASLAAQSIVRRVGNERDDAIADLRRMTTERDSLRERLKISTDTHLGDKARLEQRVEDLELLLQKAEQERNSSQSRVSSLQAMIVTLEEQVRTQVLRIEEAKEDASASKAQASKMRLIADQTEQSVEEYQRRLHTKSGDLQVAEERIVRLEERITDMNANNALLRDEINELRGTVASIDREKDALQMAVDEKTERVIDLERDLIEKGRTIGDLRATVHDLETRLEQAVSDLGSKDREIRSLRRQLDSTRDELTDASRGRDVTIRENRRLQEDLATMTRENQTVNQELEVAIEERSTLKTQVQEYIAEVARIEDLLAGKEREHRDLLDNYRSATAEAQRWETEATERTSESSNMRLELMAKDTEMKRMRERVDEMEREIHEHLSTQQTYEMQVSNLTRSLSNMEGNLRQLQDEKDSVVQDLAAVRELCVKLDSTKESLSRQLTARNIEFEQCEARTEDLKREVEMLRSQVSTERTTVRNLEAMIAGNREKEFQAQLDSQEQRSELQLIKDRLALADSKVQSQSREIQTLRSRTTQQESELDRIKRQLTSERFEKERLTQEMRRSSSHGRSVANSSVSFENRTSTSHITSTLTTSSSRRRSSSPQRASSPIHQIISPEHSLRRSPERSILKTSRSSSPYRSRSPERR
ncbi:centrosomal protein of 135 kDa-like [Diadema antillarum]|uniref:centrosomal protein of 135 kDa-like n=1 Tax=Diadema antillarum TaxID=105358 RepID=UPI003A8C4993